jgi:hypothetical protein
LRRSAGPGARSGGREEVERGLRGEERGMGGAERGLRGGERGMEGAERGVRGPEVAEYAAPRVHSASHRPSPDRRQAWNSR